MAAEVAKGAEVATKTREAIFVAVSAKRSSAEKAAEAFYAELKVLAAGSGGNGS